MPFARFEDVFHCDFSLFSGDRSCKWCAQAGRSAEMASLFTFGVGFELTHGNLKHLARKQNRIHKTDKWRCEKKRDIFQFAAFPIVWHGLILGHFTHGD
jgi:hypothetical protein